MDAKQQTDRLIELIAQLNSVPALKTQGFLDLDAHRIDVLSLWRATIEYDAMPSSFISLQESWPRIDDWLVQSAAFLGIGSAMLVSVPKYAVVPLTKVTTVPGSDWIAPLCRTLRQNSQELDLIVANPEQTRLLVFLESEHDILAFERASELRSL
jgi:hypothetical protein